METASVESLRCIQLTLDWLDRVVIGLELCPFAGPVRRADGIRVAVASGVSESALLVSLLEELDLLQQAEESDISTTLLVMPDALPEFDAYWRFTEIANGMLAQTGLEGVIQLATFHPRYLFAGEPEQALSHFTNRSPFPMLHLIREQQLERLLAQFPDADQIPRRNAVTLEQLGRERLLALLADTQ